ncbi:CU044_5270 family protein [Actinoallomurus liliacearum]
MIDNEIDLVGRVRPAVPAQDTGARARAWARLHAQMEANPEARSRKVRRRLGRPLAATGIVAAGVATAIVVAQTGGTTPPKAPRPGVTTALPSLELAAATVEHQTQTLPRPDQWIYTRTLYTNSVPAPGHVQAAPVVERWDQYGATRTASIDRRTGRLHVTYDAEAARATEGLKLPQLVKYVNGLPTDPAALLARVRKDSKSKLFVSTVGNGDKNGPVFESIQLIFMNDPFIPPKVNAALFRMLKGFPGVHLEQVTDAAGRRTVGVYRDSPGEDRREILFDPTTFRYRGSRLVAVQDMTTDGTPKLVQRVGQVLSQSALVTVKVTDKPGQR